MFDFPYVNKSVNKNPLDVYRIFVIPKKMLSAYTKRFPMSEFLSYKNFREICSISDIAHICALRTVVNNINHATLASDVQCIFDESHMTEDERCEFNNSIQPLLTKEYCETVKKFYRINGDDDCCVCGEVGGSVGDPDILKKDPPIDLPYQIVQHTRSIYITVEEGFVDCLSKKKTFLEFLSVVLNTAYQVSSLNVVNTSEFYAAYLKALKT